MGPRGPAGGRTVATTVEARILRIAAGGDGVGHLADGRVVFVPRTAPGDHVALAQLREHRRFARAQVGTLLEAGPDRVVPPCEHYLADACGGCQLQHLSAPAQRAARAAIVGDALRRLGGFEVPDPPLEPAPEQFGYRTRITLHPGHDGRLGFHRAGEAGRVVDLRDCLLAAAPLRALLAALRGARRLLPRTVQDVTLRLDRQGGLHLLVRVTGTTPWAEAPRLHAALAAEGLAVTVWWQPEGGAARTVAGAEEAFPATVFEQVHPVMGDRVRAAAVEALGVVEGRRVWDLYAGIGETTLLLHQRGALVESVERDRRAVAHAEAQLPGRRQVPSIIRHAGAVEEVLRELGTPALVVTNPPRGGMESAVTAALGAHQPAIIAYISCDPATLARDLRALPGYRLASVRAFDQFPQTAHVETLAVLERA